MNTVIRQAQFRILEAFLKSSRTFALSGGTALELFYLKHRFSRDLDFFSPEYNLKEISSLVSKFAACIGEDVKLESEFTASNRARVRFYAVKIKGTSSPLKIDFIEDVFFENPVVRKFNQIPVYDINHIYFQKLVALVGTRLKEDETGREVITGRKETRDVVDIYYLSKKISPLHKFLKNVSREQQRGIVQWYRSYSRQELKLGVLDLDIYDRKFDAACMIRHLDGEIKKFMDEVLK